MRNLRGLHIALTWRYLLVTVSALLIVELAAILLITRGAPAYAFNMQPDIYLLEQLAETAAGYLEHGREDELDSWLQSLQQPVVNLTMNNDWLRLNFSRFPQRKDQVLIVFRQQDGVVAITPPDSAYHTIGSIEELPGPLSSSLFQTVPAQRGANGVTVHSGSQSISVTPIQRANGELLALLILLNFSPDTPPSLIEVLALLGGSVLVLTAAVGGLGALFGFFASRFLVGRIHRMVATTASWGVGDFSRPIVDAPSERDEIDDLAQHLNQLRTQIQELLAQRERWATAEERSRVARELHDSVKQQVFTLRMHLATAQTLGAQNQPEAAHYLQSAISVAQQAQDELTGIIQLFHRPAGSAPDLASRLADLTARWSQQARIPLELAQHGPFLASLEVEHGLLRVVQEALANVYKHSRADCVQVVLTQEQNQIRLLVADNGAGFDPLAGHSGLGLVSMRERVEALGGRLEIVSGATGTRVEAVVPVEE